MAQGRSERWNGCPPPLPLLGIGGRFWLTGWYSSDSFRAVPGAVVALVRGHVSCVQSFLQLPVETIALTASAGFLRACRRVHVPQFRPQS
jgi:hypothetical protein